MGSAQNITDSKATIARMGFAALAVLGVTAAGVGHARFRRELRELDERHREQMEIMHAWYRLGRALRAPAPQQTESGSAGQARRQLGARRPVMTDAALEPADRRRLMEAHLREQMAAEMDEQGRQRYAEGYADGIRRRGEGTPD